VCNYIKEKIVFWLRKILPSYGWLPPYSLVFKKSANAPKIGEKTAVQFGLVPPYIIVGYLHGPCTKGRPRDQTSLLLVMIARVKMFKSWSKYKSAILQYGTQGVSFKVHLI